MKRKRNHGWFAPGHDPRRHQLTPEERRRGGFVWFRRHYMGGDYARALGQRPAGDQAELDEEARNAGDHDRPGTNGEASADAGEV